MLEKSDYIFADSNYEANILKSISKRVDNVKVAHLGVLKTDFKPKFESSENEYFLAVGDFLEIRKRIDITIELYRNYLDLGGQKDVIAGDTASGDGGTDFGLIAIDESRVDMAVADFQGGLDHGSRGRTIQLPCAKADGWNTQVCGRDGMHG